MQTELEMQLASQKFEHEHRKCHQEHENRNGLLSCLHEIERHVCFHDRGIKFEGSICFFHVEPTPGFVAVNYLLTILGNTKFSQWLDSYKVNFHRTAAVAHSVLTLAIL